MKWLNRRQILAWGTAATAASIAFPTVARQVSETNATLAPLNAQPSLETYIKPPIVDQIALSPDGKRIAFITQSGDDRRLGFFDIAAPKVKSVHLGKIKTRGLFWGDNDHIVFVDSLTDSVPGFTFGLHEFFQAQVLDVRTGDVQTLFRKVDGFYNIIFGDLKRLKINDQYRVTASSIRMNGDFERALFSFELDTHVVHNLGEGTRYAEGFVTTPTGYVVAYSEMDDDRHIWALYYNTGAEGTSPRFKKIYEVRDAEDYPDLLGLGRDSTSLVIAVKTPDRDGENYHEITADGALGPVLDPEDADRPRSPLFHPVTHCFCGFVIHDDWFTYRYDDDLLKRLAEGVPQVIGADLRFTLVDFAEDPRKMIVRSENAGDAGSYVFIDFSTGDSVPVAVDYPGLPAEWIFEKQAISYKASDGLEIHGYLTLPKGKALTALPLIVLPHGGPQARDHIDFDGEAQAFASRGYAVLQPNFRGSTGYGAAFAKAGNGEWGRKMQSDLSDGIRDLAQKGIVDAKRVAIYGASYGGYAALAGATLDPAGTYRCAVSIAGISDLAAMIDFESVKYDNRNSSYVRQFLTEIGDSKTYGDISPARQAAKASCPVLMIHGTDDTVVPIDQSQRMERALKSAGKDAQLITYKGQDHWETMGVARVAMFQAAVDFIQKHNPA